MTNIFVFRLDPICVLWSRRMMHSEFCIMIWHQLDVLIADLNDINRGLVLRIACLNGTALLKYIARTGFVVRKTVSLLSLHNKS